MTSEQQTTKGDDSRERGGADSIEWETKELDEIADINPGSINDDSFDFNKIKYLDISSTGNGFIEELSNYSLEEAPSRAKRTVKPGDTVISRVRPIREQYTLIRDPSSNLVVSTGFAVLRPNEGLNHKYLYYATTTPSMIRWMDNHTSGSAYPAVNISTLKHAEIPVPPIQIQRKIGKVLDDIDSKIQVNKNIIDHLKQMSETLFEFFFIDFEQYNGEMRFDDEFNKEVPSTWETQSLQNVADFLNGKAWQQFVNENGPNDLPVIKIKELRNGISEDSDRVSKSSCPEEYIIDYGQVVFSWSASLVLDLWTDGPAFLNQHLFKVTSEEYPRWFNYEWLNHHIQHFRHIADAKKTTMGHIKRSDLEEARVLTPPKKELEAISKKFEPIFDSMVELRIENQRLENLRDTLLPKLMSGEIRVDDIKLDELEVDSGV